MSIYIFATFGTRSEMYGQATWQDGRAIAVLGVSVPWDSPTEFWTFDSSSTLADNGTTVIKPTDITGAGRFLFKSYLQQQYGNIYSKVWRGSATTSGSTVTFDISGAGFTSIVDWEVKAFLNGAGATTLPIPGVTAKSITSFTVTLVDSKTTNTLLISTAEGLELHAVAGTEVYLTVYGK